MRRATGGFFRQIFLGSGGLQSSVGYRRRSLVRMVGGAFCVGLAGCTSTIRSTPSPDGVRLTKLTVLNRATDPHHIDVVVRDDETDAVVFWNRFDAPAATADSETDELDSVGRTVWADPVSKPGSYSVYADADITAEPNSSSWATTDLPASSNTDCIAVDIILSRDEQLRVQAYSRSCG